MNTSQCNVPKDHYLVTYSDGSAELRFSPGLEDRRALEARREAQAVAIVFYSKQRRAVLQSDGRWLEDNRAR